MPASNHEMLGGLKEVTTLENRLSWGGGSPTGVGRLEVEERKTTGALPSP